MVQPSQRNSIIHLEKGPNLIHAVVPEWNDGLCGEEALLK